MCDCKLHPRSFSICQRELEFSVDGEDMTCVVCAYLGYYEDEMDNCGLTRVEMCDEDGNVREPTEAERQAIEAAFERVAGNWFKGECRSAAESAAEEEAEYRAYSRMHDYW